MVKKTYMLFRWIERKYCKMLALRSVKQHGKNIHINHYCRFTRRTILGDNVHFNGFKVFGKGELEIKSNFHSAPGCIVLTSSHNYEGESLPYDETNIVKKITIEENVWLGLRVIILPGVTIGEGAIIQAGSCVTSDIPPLAIAGGHPAKVFKYRDKDHYESLKKKGAYF